MSPNSDADKRPSSISKIRLRNSPRRLAIGRDGAAALATQIPSPNCDARPPGTTISLIVVHGISLPPGRFGGDDVARLFTNTLDPDADPYFSGIAHLKVSSHFFICRDGELVQFVSCGRRAWHAGVSSWRGRAILQRLFGGNRTGGDRRPALRRSAISGVGASRACLACPLPNPGHGRPQRCRPRSQNRPWPLLRLVETGPTAWGPSHQWPGRRLASGPWSPSAPNCSLPGPGQARDPRAAQPSVIMGGCPLRAVSG